MLWGKKWKDQSREGGLLRGGVVLREAVPLGPTAKTGGKLARWLGQGEGNS